MGIYTDGGLTLNTKPKIIIIIISFAFLLVNNTQDFWQFAQSPDARNPTREKNLFALYGKYPHQDCKKARASQPSRGILPILTAVVIFILSEGDILDGFDAGVGGKDKKKGKQPR